MPKRVIRVRAMEEDDRPWLDALREGSGIGTALSNALAKVLRDAAPRSSVGATTNHNLAVLGFYQQTRTMEKVASNAAGETKPYNRKGSNRGGAHRR